MIERCDHCTRLNAFQPASEGSGSGVGSGVGEGGGGVCVAALFDSCFRPRATLGLSEET